MTWAVSAARRCLGDLLTRGDLAHVGPDRDGTEWASTALGGVRAAPRETLTAPLGPFNGPRLTGG